MSDDLLLRDFIYLDIERVRSFVAQVAGGLTNELSTKDEEKNGRKGEIQGGLPTGILKGTGALDYHYIRTQSETKSLHDAIFREFQTAVLEAGNLIDLTNVSKDAWTEELFVDGAFLTTGGALKVLDYESAARTLESFPKMESAITRLASGNQASAPKAARHKPQSAQLPIKELTAVLDQFYGDTVRLKIFPFPSIPRFVLVGTADRSMFRYPPGLLANTYGMVIDAGWTYVLQVNRGVSYPVEGLASVTGNQVEDSLEQLVDRLVSLNVLAQGVQFPAVAFTPIAIFRSV